MLVSIIIPVYNQEQYLRQAIESALAQDVTDVLEGDSLSLEVIVVDDKSTDNSLEVARECKAREREREIQEFEAETARQAQELRGPDGLSEPPYYWVTARMREFQRRKIGDMKVMRNDGGYDIYPAFGSRLRIIEQHQNMGLVIARNTGINAASSKMGYDFILPLDADDWIEPNYIKKTAPLIKDRVGVVGTHVAVFGIRDYVWTTHSPTIQDLMKDNCVPVCSLIRRGVIEETENYYNAQLTSGYEDWNLWIDILKRGWKIEILPERLFHYREKPQSMLRDSTKIRPQLVAKIHELHPDLWPTPESEKRSPQKWGNMNGFNIDTCKWVMWGGRDDRNTFGHIHWAFYRALKHMGKEVYYLDKNDDMSKIDFHNTFFMSMNCVLTGLPQRKDCLYFIHNITGDPRAPYFDGLNLMRWGVHVISNKYSSDVQEIGPDIFFDPSSRTVMMYWGTDLLPHEIEANKPMRVFNAESRVCNYIGSIDGMKNQAIADFARACKENGIEYQGFGGYNNGRVVSIEEHIQLIKDSYMAPAFQGLDQIAQGYQSCRIFKNLSYGQMPLIQSKYSHDLFKGRLIFNTDAYKLFYEGRERLQSLSLTELHSLMDEVAQKHTYLNKIAGVIHAVKALE